MTKQPPAHSVSNIPNLLTLFRLVMVPLVVWLILTHNLKAAFYIFLLAGITDAIDGYLARKWNSQTELGAYLDPAADKSLIVGIFLTLGFLSLIPLWLVIIVVSRDIFIVGAILISWLMDKPVRIHPLFISKANTALQIILAAFILANQGFNLQLGSLENSLCILTAIVTLLSAFSYFQAWLDHLNE